MNDEDLRAGIALLVRVLPPKRGSWAITGSAALRLRGFLLEPADIDIIATRSCAETAALRLSTFAMTPLAWRRADRILSLFAQYKLRNVTVEIMADVWNQHQEGSWTSHMGWSNHIESVAFDATSVPMLTLEYEAALAETLGQRARLALLRQRLPNRVFAPLD